MIGKTTSHYKILEKLGEGGMGVVYKAEDTKLKRTVALKFLPPELVRSAEWKERFLREAQAAAALDHPNICTLYETYEAEGETFIAMAFCDGQTLEEKIKAGPLDIDKAVNIAIHVGEGLKQAHKQGIIHRDIKSANIMLDETGRARIMDFGLAKLVGRTKLTDTSTIMGTVDYMSPEQAQGEPVDHRSDIWSLGVVLYEMLTGETPFDAPSNAAVIHKIIYEDPAEVESLNPNVPPGLRAVVARAIAKNKEDRYASIAEFLDDLHNYESLPPEKQALAGKPAGTRPISTARPVSSTRVKRGIAAAVVAVVVCLCVAFIWFFQRPKTAPISEKQAFSSIVVLPFEDMSEAKDQEYFCEGISEELINALTQIKDLRVIARTSAFSFKGKGMKISDIGKELNVETVLEGSVRRAGDKLRISANLVNVANNEHLFHFEQYDKEIRDIFAIQDEITAAIVENLQVKLLGGESATIAKRQTVDIEAYHLYLKGRWFSNKLTKEGLKKGIEYFERTIEKAPDYAPAYAGLAVAYSSLPIYGYAPSTETFPKAKAAAEKALQIDNINAQAQIRLAYIEMAYDWDWEGAENEFKRVIKLYPGYANAHYLYSLHLMFTARFDEAIEEVKLALELDPLSLYISRGVGIAYNFAHRYDEAIEALQSTLEMDRNFSRTHFELGRAYVGKSMFKSALAEYQKEKEIIGSWDPAIETYIGITYAKMGRRDDAQRILDDLIERSKEGYVSPWFLAKFSFALGENDQGFKWLDEVYEEHGIMACLIKSHPELDSIRSDPRYIALVKKIGLDK